MYVCIHLKFYSNDGIFWVHVVHVYKQYTVVFSSIVLERYNCHWRTLMVTLSSAGGGQPLLSAEMCVMLSLTCK